MNTKTFYLAKENPKFMEIAKLVCAVEADANIVKEPMHIISAYTGEVFAIRNSVGLWEILVS